VHFTRWQPQCCKLTSSFEFGGKARNQIGIKFCTVVVVPDVVICANFGDYWFMGSGATGGQISHFSVGFRRRASE